MQKDTTMSDVLMYNNSKNAGEEMDDDSHHTTSCGADVKQRDEVAEVKKIAIKETRRVRVMRLVIVILLLAALVVTFVTYRLLQQEQKKIFEGAFAQFSDSLATAARDHREDIAEAYKTLAESLTASAEIAGATWPFYQMPFFEHHAT